MAEAAAPGSGHKQRFYGSVAVTAGEDGRHAILLDGRQARTPQGARLAVEDRSIAEAIAAEWHAQGARIEPASMPLTRLAATAIDRVAAAREAVIDEVVGYAGSDLVCYRATAPAGLAERQAAHWDPVVRWAEGVAGCRLSLVGGMTHTEQPPAALAAYRVRACHLDDLRLAALALATTTTGSALIALALAHAVIEAEAAWAAAHVDEDWQIAHWGEDAEAARRRAAMSRDFFAAARVLTRT